MSATKGSTGSDRRNWDTAADNETLFDFLKRKKRHALETTVTKTLQHHSYTKKKIDLDADLDDFPRATEHSQPQYHSHSNREAARPPKQHITPRKIDFDEPPAATRHTPKEPSPAVKAQAATNAQARSFLAMISPIKNRPASALAQTYNEKEKENAPKSSRKPTANESFSKKGVTGCINAIKEAMHALTDNLRTLREKSHGLVVQFNPLLTHIAEAAPAKQVGDFRNRLRAFEAQLSAVDIDHTDDTLQRFHRSLEEHLQFEEGQLRRSLQRAKEEELASIKAEAEAEVERLSAENRRLSKEVELLQRRLQRAENTHQDLAEAATERQVSSLEQMERIKLNYEKTIEQLRSTNQQLSQKCQNLTEANRVLQQDCKTERFAREELQERNRDEIQKILEAKDAYLINELMVLKAEFNADLARVGETHRIKEAELMRRLAECEQEAARAVERGGEREVESAARAGEAGAVREENERLRAQHECIVNDMYRMNEQLYQHWMALKDVKALALRLSAFPHYRQIYDDLRFNDHLFH